MSNEFMHLHLSSHFYTSENILWGRGGEGGDEEFLSAWGDGTTLVASFVAGGDVSKNVYFHFFFDLQVDFTVISTP